MNSALPSPADYTLTAPLKLLIVDDSLVIRRSIERHIEKWNFASIQTAGNGAIAMEIFRKEPADIVTMDITMPEMDGLSCVEAMLRIKPNVQILVISALADKSTAVEAVKRGAMGFLLKPFDAAKIHEALQEMIEDVV
ncbi:MAG: response regulator [Verrucomicrobiota bacterium]